MTKVIIVDLSKGQQTIEIHDGATIEDVLATADIPSSVDIRTGGQDAREIADQPVKDGQRFTTQPKSLKNGS